MITSNILTDEALSQLLVIPLKVQDYLIIQVNVYQNPNSNLRLANAVVINRIDGRWDESTIHIIELKHCYNRASKCARLPLYQELKDKILIVTNIAPPKYGDLNIVNWTFIAPEDEFLYDELCLNEEISEEDLMLIYDNQRNKTDH